MMCLQRARTDWSRQTQSAFRIAVLVVVLEQRLRMRPRAAGRRYFRRSAGPIRPYDVLTYVSVPTSLDFINELGHDLKEVTDHTEVCHVKNWGVFVFVDGNNGLGGLHTSQVLDSTRDSYSDVEIWRYGYTGLADLEIRWNVSGVHSGTRGADGSVELVGQVLDEFEVLFGT